MKYSQIFLFSGLLLISATAFAQTQTIRFPEHITLNQSEVDELNKESKTFISIGGKTFSVVRNSVKGKMREALVGSYYLTHSEEDSPDVGPICLVEQGDIKKPVSAQTTLLVAEYSLDPLHTVSISMPLPARANLDHEIVLTPHFNDNTHGGSLEVNKQVKERTCNPYSNNDKAQFDETRCVISWTQRKSIPH